MKLIFKKKYLKYFYGIIIALIAILAFKLGGYRCPNCNAHHYINTFVCPTCDECDYQFIKPWWK